GAAARRTTAPAAPTGAHRWHRALPSCASVPSAPREPVPVSSATDGSPAPASPVRCRRTVHLDREICPACPLAKIDSPPINVNHIRRRTASRFFSRLLAQFSNPNTRPTPYTESEIWSTMMFKGSDQSRRTLLATLLAAAASPLLPQDQLNAQAVPRPFRIDIP